LTTSVMSIVGVGL